MGGGGGGGGKCPAPYKKGVGIIQEGQMSGRICPGEQCPDSSAGKTMTVSQKR